jgi:isopentenyl-diphosphate delta-isomerase
MNYYKKEQFIAAVDKNGNILGSIEKWEAHKKGILHKAFSVTLQYKDTYILQHRKHPVFDGVFDLSCSSHQLMKGGKLESDTDAVLKTLKREWKIDKTNITGKIQNIGVTYYKSKDENSKYIEHELCDQFLIKIKKLPQIHTDYAYGYSLVTEKELKNKRSRIWKNLAPWSKKAVELL